MHTLYKDDDCLLSVSYDETLNVFLLHTEIYKWSLSKYKKYLKVLAECLNFLKNEKIEEVYSFVTDEKKQRFNELFGFVPCGEGLAQDHSKFIVMILRT